MRSLKRQRGFIGIASVVAPIIGSIISSNGAQSAADTQAQAAGQSTALQSQIFGQTTQNLAPYLQSGQSAQNNLNYLLGNVNGTTSDSTIAGQVGLGGAPGGLLQPFSLANFQQDPGYQFQLQQGQQAINNSAAASGKSYAPATLQSLAQFNQGLANTDYQQAYSNYNNNMGNIYSRLAGLAGTGQNAAVQQGGFGANFATSAGNNILGAANAQSAAQVSGANALSGGINGVYNNLLTQQILGNSQGSSLGNSSVFGQAGGSPLDFSSGNLSSVLGNLGLGGS